MTPRRWLTPHLKRRWEAGQREFAWIHVYNGAPVPPTGGGSFNHLLWDILQRRSDHLLISSYFPDSFALAADREVNLIQVEFRRRIRRVERLKHYLEGKPLVDDLDFFDEAHLTIERTEPKGKILLWGSMRPLPALRRRFPGRTIAYAQRFYEHSYDVSDYLHNLDILLVQTPGTAKLAFEKHAAVPSLVISIPNGVELDVFKPQPELRKAQLREELGIPAEPELVAIFPSKLSPIKGTAYLLEWIRQFGAKENKVHFLVVGGKHKAKIRGFTLQLERVLNSAANVTWIAGIPRSEMPKVYQAADICLMPGVRREGMSMAAQEALASGLPLVACAHGIYPEIVKHEYNGLLLRPEHLFHDGVEAIERLERDVDLRNRLALNARAYAKSRLPRGRCLDNFDRFFEERYLDIDADLSFPDHG